MAFGYQGWTLKSILQLPVYNSSLDLCLLLIPKDAKAAAQLLLWWTPTSFLEARVETASSHRPSTFVLLLWGILLQQQGEWLTGTTGKGWVTVGAWGLSRCWACQALSRINTPSSYSATCPVSYLTGSQSQTDNHYSWNGRVVLDLFSLVSFVVVTFLSWYSSWLLFLELSTEARHESSLTKLSYLTTPVCSTVFTRKDFVQQVDFQEFSDLT